MAVYASNWTDESAALVGFLAVDQARRPRFSLGGEPDHVSTARVEDVGVECGARAVHCRNVVGEWQRK
jgi:hypothetical protein